MKSICERGCGSSGKEVWSDLSPLAGISGMMFETIAEESRGVGLAGLASCRGSRPDFGYSLGQWMNEAPKQPSQWMKGNDISGLKF